MIKEKQLVGIWSCSNSCGSAQAFQIRCIFIASIKGTKSFVFSKIAKLFDIFLFASKYNFFTNKLVLISFAITIAVVKLATMKLNNIILKLEQICYYTVQVQISNVWFASYGKYFNSKHTNYINVFYPSFSSCVGHSLL